MQRAATVLNIIRERGQRGLPLERLYRQLYNRDLYLRAYGKLYANKGAMTPGATPETVDSMTLAKIDHIIELVSTEGYRWTPVRRTYIPKKNGKLRGLGMPTWSDKLLQEVIRSLLEAYYEPQFSVHSHGFRPGRGCHTALQEIMQTWKGVKWFIEGDLCACFDTIDHSILLNILREKIHDNRFIRLIENLLKAGYLEEWRYNATYSGVPQGGVLSPLLSNLVLDRLDKFVEQTLMPAHTRGHRRKTYPPYVALTKAASQARRAGDLISAKMFNQQAQAIPSRDPVDPHFRRLRFCRYADDFLLGFTGSKAEAEEIKRQLSTFLREELKLELSAEKTLITHAREGMAHFLGYDIHTLYADDKHDKRGQRSINGSIGLRVPAQVIHAHCRRYMRNGKPVYLPQRVIDDAYSTVARYQGEYRGLVQYYKLAYNLHRLSQLKWVMASSLTKTLAHKYKTTQRKIYRRFRKTLDTEEGTYKVIEVTLDRGAEKKPLVTYFGGVSLRWNKWVAIKDTLHQPIWSQRTELVDRLLAQQCELCGATDTIEVHHIRKLKDLDKLGQPAKPEWARQMSARHRKTLVVCQKCHNDIHYGRYHGPARLN
jgi:group II intron reverse transcriptase/maturase